MDSMIHDIRRALKAFGANKSFTVAAVFCLGLGIGANTAIFSVFESIFLRPLPFERPDQLISVRERSRRTERTRRLTYRQYLELRQQIESFEQIEAYAGSRQALTETAGKERAELVEGEFVSHGLLRMFGIGPQLGRGFSAADHDPSSPLTVLLSDSIWTRRYGRDAAVLGRVINLNSEPHTVVGVMPPGFRYPESSDVWLPLGRELEAAAPERHRVAIVGRLKTGVREAEASAELSTLESRLTPNPGEEAEVWDLWGRRLSSLFIGREERLVVGAMMGAVCFLLLLACTNVASLLLVRGAARRSEFAVRSALGATRMRLIQQLLIEALLLAVTATTLALPLAWWGLRAFSAAIPASDPFPFYVAFSLNTPTLLYTSLVAIATSLLFGTAPAITASRTSSREVLSAEGRGIGMGRRRARGLSALVVTEIALAATLLVGASLFARQFLALRHVELGYDPSRIMTMRFYLPGAAYDNPEARLHTVLEIQRQLENVPGVKYATVSDLIPLEDDGGNTDLVELEGVTQVAREHRMFYAGVVGDWLETFDVVPLEGRDFEASELRRGTPVAIINQTMAREFWPGGDAVGRRFRLVNDRTRQWMSVVGVIPDIRTVKLDEDQRTPPTAFLPIHLLDTRDFGVMLRTLVPPVSVTQDARAAIRHADPNVPAYKVQPMSRVRWLSFWMYGLWGTTFFAFGVIALLLATVGVYEVVSYSLLERIHEIGVRMALGAPRSSVVGLLVGRAAKFALLGLSIGVLSSFFLSRVVESLLIGVSTTEPATYAAAVALLGAATLVACIVSALRAARLDIATALRQ